MIALYYLINLYALVVLARLVLSWFPIRADNPAMPVIRGIYLITEPPLSVLRSVIPVVRIGTGALDLSATVLLLALWLLARLVLSMA